MVLFGRVINVVELAFCALVTTPLLCFEYNHAPHLIEVFLAVIFEHVVVAERKELAVLHVFTYVVKVDVRHLGQLLLLS